MGDFENILEQEEKTYAITLLQNVVGLLLAQPWTLACAESLTGGLLAAALTRFAKSSNFFLGSVVCYHPRIKVEAVGVDPALIRQFGVVSAPVAQAMALGIAGRFQARIGVSTTGVAGPDPHGGVAVGTVFAAVALDQRCKVQRLDLRGDRQQIRQAAVLQTLKLLENNLRTASVTGG